MKQFKKDFDSLWNKILLC